MLEEKGGEGSGRWDFELNLERVFALELGSASMLTSKSDSTTFIRMIIVDQLRVMTSGCSAHFAGGMYLRQRARLFALR